MDIIINAGYAGSAWSGGDVWKDENLVEILTKWVYEGGGFLGVNEPSAVEGYDTYFRMAHVLGIDEDRGERICHGKWDFRTDKIDKLIPDGVHICGKAHRYLTDGTARVLLEENGKFELNKSGLVMYSHGEYFSMGKSLGKFGFSVKKKK